jgi:DNA polymerase III sliding clamp (beta) subunit (PCNA family)
LGGSEEIEQSTYYGFAQGRVITFNDEISISHPVEGLNITGAVHAKELHGLLKKLKKEDIEIEEKDGEVRLSAGRARAGFKIKELTMPLDEVNQKTDWEDLPEGFAEKVAFVLPCVSTRMDQPKFNCVHVNKEGFVEATDNFRIAVGFLPESMDSTFLIPAKSAKEVVKLEPIQYNIGKNWTHFRNEEGTILSCRTFAESFFDTTRFTTIEDGTGTDIEFPEEINKILPRAEVVLQDLDFENQSVEITVEDGQIVVRSESELSWFEESERTNYIGDPIVFFATPKLLEDIVKKTHQAKITKERDRIGFFGDDWAYVALLRT